MKNWQPFIAPVDVRLLRADEEDGHIDTLVQPAVQVVCGRAKLDRPGVRGAPDHVRALNALGRESWLDSRVPTPIDITSR